ncbi:hypothetical protein KCU61_g36, partial [Aureobasidium melanogenum]
MLFLRVALIIIIIVMSSAMVLFLGLVVLSSSANALLLHFTIPATIRPANFSALLVAISRDTEGWALASLHTTSNAANKTTEDRAKSTTTDSLADEVSGLLLEATGRTAARTAIATRGVMMLATTDKVVDAFHDSCMSCCSGSVVVLLLLEERLATTISSRSRSDFSCHHCSITPNMMVVEDTIDNTIESPGNVDVLVVPTLDNLRNDPLEHSTSNLSGRLVENVGEMILGEHRMLSCSLVVELKDGVNLVLNLLELLGPFLWSSRRKIHIRHLRSSSVTLQLVNFAGLVFAAEKAGRKGLEKLLEQAGILFLRVIHDALQLLKLRLSSFVIQLTHDRVKEVDTTKGTRDDGVDRMAGPLDTDLGVAADVRKDITLA